ncbi:hypothetical protein BpHYR1_046241 [Brachionus plicatilis]|uniref:Uncharacterized protein n=1 Tax=Brachionus plicatilis TaxID=10195 RepID=A0A3M7PHL2_BRAPC|nr:hypothetical protein BpHYR1_046241 [Brachionus plicatilis]
MLKKINYVLYPHILQELCDETGFQAILMIKDFKISFLITTLCNIQSCISYQGLQNSANLADFDSTVKSGYKKFEFAQEKISYIRQFLLNEKFFLVSNT